MVSIILLSYNQWSATEACLDSIKKNVSIPHEVIVVDNASKEETVKELKKRSGIHVVYNQTNMGFPAGCNIGLAAAKGNIIWFLNNDTIVSKNSLETMVKLLLSDESIGMVGPVTNNIDGIQQIPVTYSSNNMIDDFSREIAERYKDQTMRVIRLTGFSMLVRKDTLDKLGGFDERMGIGTFEDDDLSLRLVANGYKLLIAKDAFIHHTGNVSFKGAGGYPFYDDRNQRIVSTTFGMTVPDETTIRKGLLEKLKPERNILHIECRAGALGLRMQEEGKKIFGLDNSQDNYEVAKEHYNEFYTYVVDKDIELPAPLNFFDTVIAEYQFDDSKTAKLFSDINKNIKEKAQIIISIPKVVGRNGEVFDTYLDKWNKNTGYYPVRGKFNLALFIETMESMGFAIVDYEVKDVVKGFFNNNSFLRHRENWEGQEGDFDFFKEIFIEFVKR